MMPKPNQSKNSYDKREFNKRSSEKILFETKPNLLLYADNFILKFVVLFFLVFMFSPILAIVYNLQGNLQYGYGFDLSNMTFIAELIILFCILIVIIKIILDYLDWNYTTYVLTDRRVIINRGFFNKESISISYSKIQDIDLSQSFLERMLGAGDIIVYGGHDNSETILDEVPDPKKVESLILENINKHMNYNYNNFYNQNPYPNQPVNNQYNNPYPNQEVNNHYPNRQRNNPYPENNQYNPQQNNNYNREYYNNQQNDYSPQNEYINQETRPNRSENEYQNQEYNQGYMVHEEYDNHTHYYSNNNISHENIREDYNKDLKQSNQQKIDKNELLNRNKRKFKKSK